MNDLRDFVLEGLAEDERRAADGKTPLLEDAEQMGRLRVMRTDDGRGLLLAAGGTVPITDDPPVTFREKLEFLRAEVEAGADEPTLRMLAAAYDTRVGWQEEWRTYV